MLINSSLALILWVGNIWCKSDVHPASIRTIPLPKDFYHVKGADSAFAEWLLDQKIRDDNTVYLFNGTKKENQRSQYAVLDIEIGSKDLLQCADAVMKLRADHLYQESRYDKISFLSTSGIALSYLQWKQGFRWKQVGNKLVKFTSSLNVTDSYSSFMDFVYSYCGTYSLSNQLKAVSEIRSIRPGDVFIQGGFPGHAVIVMSVAKNSDGKTIFLLAQGYMPAQDIHILKNPTNSNLSPWYSLDEIQPLVTPEWSFKGGNLKRW